MKSELNVTLVDNIDKANPTDHIMIMTNSIPGTAVGLGEAQGTISSVENGTTKNGTFDLVGSHELGHNMGLEHTGGGLMNKSVDTGTGRAGLSSTQLKQIFGGAVTLPNGNTKLYNDGDNRKRAKEFKNEAILSNIINWLVIFICIFVMSSCSNNDEKVERTSMTGFSIDIPAKWCLDTNESNAIDSYVGKIILNTRDTLYFEYGKGIYNIVDPVKAIVPVSQKHYWDSVGMGGDVIISNNPALDATLNIYSNEYYLKDTIDNIEVNWVFPKKI